MACPCSHPPVETLRVFQAREGGSELFVLSQSTLKVALFLPNIPISEDGDSSKRPEYSCLCLGTKISQAHVIEGAG